MGYTQDCLNHDQCSWENNASGGLMNSDCGDEWSNAVDDYVFASCPTPKVMKVKGQMEGEEYTDENEVDNSFPVEEAKYDRAFEDTVALVGIDEDEIGLNPSSKKRPPLRGSFPSNTNQNSEVGEKFFAKDAVKKNKKQMKKKTKAEANQQLREELKQKD